MTKKTIKRGRAATAPDGSRSRVRCRTIVGCGTDTAPRAVAMAWGMTMTSDEAARRIGVAAAWVEVFARVIVPLGAVVWRTDEPEVGRWVIDRLGLDIQIPDRNESELWAVEAQELPQHFAWRYLTDDEVP